MAMKTKARDTISGIYENGVFRIKGRVPFRNHERVMIRIVRKPDPVEGTWGIIRVSPRFARELTTPHKYGLWDR